MFSCKFCKTFQNIFFTEYLRTAASKSFPFFNGATLITKRIASLCFEKSLVLEILGEKEQKYV